MGWWEGGLADWWWEEMGSLVCRMAKGGGQDPRGMGIWGGMGREGGERGWGGCPSRDEVDEWWDKVIQRRTERVTSMASA